MQINNLWSSKWSNKKNYQTTNKQTPVHMDLLNQGNVEEKTHLSRFVGHKTEEITIDSVTSRRDTPMFVFCPGIILKRSEKLSHLGEIIIRIFQGDVVGIVKRQASQQELESITVNDCPVHWPLCVTISPKLT